MLGKVCVCARKWLLCCYLFFPLAAFSVSHKPGLNKAPPRAAKQEKVSPRTQKQTGKGSIASRDKSIEEFLGALERRRYDFDRHGVQRVAVATRGAPAQDGRKTTEFHGVTSCTTISFGDIQKRWEDAKDNLLKGRLPDKEEKFSYNDKCFTATKVQELYSWAKYSFISCYHAFYLGRFYKPAKDNTVESVWNVVAKGSENFAILGRNATSQDDSQKQNFYFLMKDIFLYLYFPEKLNSFSINLKKAVEGVIEKLYYGPGNIQGSNIQGTKAPLNSRQRRMSMVPDHQCRMPYEPRQKRPVFDESIGQWLLNDDGRKLSTLDPILSGNGFSLCDNLSSRSVSLMEDKYPLGPRILDQQNNWVVSGEAEKRVYSLAMYSCLQLWRFAPDTCKVCCSTYKKADAKPKLDGKFCAIPKLPFTPSKTYVNVPVTKVNPSHKPGDTKDETSKRQQPKKKEKKKNTRDEEEISEIEERSILSLLSTGGGGRGGHDNHQPKNQSQNSKKYSIKDSILIEIMCWDPNLRSKMAKE